MASHLPKGGALVLVLNLLLLSQWETERVPLQILRVSVKVVHIMIFALHIILLQLDHMD